MHILLFTKFDRDAEAEGGRVKDRVHLPAKELTSTP